jgi:hypothetical protein
MLYATTKNAQFIVAPIKGFMFGGLYNNDEYEDLTEYTVQFCFMFVSFTMIWETPAK